MNPSLCFLTTWEHVITQRNFPLVSNAHDLFCRLGTQHKDFCEINGKNAGPGVQVQIQDLLFTDCQVSRAFINWSKSPLNFSSVNQAPWQPSFRVLLSVNNINTAVEGARQNWDLHPWQWRILPRMVSSDYPMGQQASYWNVMDRKRGNMSVLGSGRVGSSAEDDALVHTLIAKWDVTLKLNKPWLYESFYSTLIMSFIFISFHSYKHLNYVYVCVYVGMYMWVPVPAKTR